MKELFLIRHAKSSWDYDELTDFERPLNKRGRRDAQFMPKILTQQGVNPDLVITSPANRVITTAKYFCESLGYPFDNIWVEPKLYAAGNDTILSVIQNIATSFNNVMLFAHNPGLTDLTNDLANKRIDNVPTCGIVCLNLRIDSWNELGKDNGELIFFEYPKKYFK
jgi:phosphohistidine phosphatase